MQDIFFVRMLKKSQVKVLCHVGFIFSSLGRKDSSSLDGSILLIDRWGYGERECDLAKRNRDV
jgi:hypothetical protein